MNQEVKSRWVAALRSGKYRQGHHSLCSEGKFCCLGVLNDIQDNDFIIIDSSANTQTRFYANLGSGGHLPGLNSDWLEAQGVSIERQYVLVDMNDSGKSFYEIADWIEENI